MSTPKRIEQKYDESKIVEAVNAVAEGMSVRSAAMKFGISKSTLHRRMKSGLVNIKTEKGPPPIFGLNHERILVQWVRTMARAGFPVSRETLMVSARKLAVELKLTLNGQPFVPQRKWYEGFLKRHNELSIRTSQNLTSQRKSVTKTDLKKWFDDVQQYLREEKIEKVLSAPERVFNSDETAFFLNPKPGKVLAEKGAKNVYTGIGADEKQNLTVLLTVNAAGELAPPMVVFRYSRIPLAIAEAIPSSWGIGKSDNGWMTQEVFYEYITNVFEPWLTEKNIERPVVFFLDGHTSHTSYALSTFCKNKGIELIALYPNTTHLLQPVDVSVFHTLKQTWRQKVAEWRMANEGTQISKYGFPRVLESVIQTLKAEVISAGFRTCGLVPWNPEAVLKKIGEEIGKTSIEISHIEQQQFKTFLNVLKNEVGLDTYRRFENSAEDWEGELELKGLYEVWRKVTRKLDTNSPSEVALTIEQPEAGTSMEEQPEAGASMEEQPEAGVERETSPERSCPPNVPSPFKRSLYWPNTQSSTSKRKVKERLPAATTSQQVIRYLKNKEEKKRTLEAEKERRKSEREEKRRRQLFPEKVAQPQVESSSSSVSSEVVYCEESDNWEESEGTDSDIEPVSNNLEVGKFVLVEFLGGPRNKSIYIYLCVIQEISNDELKVQGFVSVKNKRQFSVKENDVSMISINQVKGVIASSPEILWSERKLLYIFPKKLPVFEK